MQDAGEVNATTVAASLSSVDLPPPRRSGSTAGWAALPAPCPAPGQTQPVTLRYTDAASGCTFDHNGSASVVSCAPGSGWGGAACGACSLGSTWSAGGYGPCQACTCGLVTSSLIDFSDFNASDASACAADAAIQTVCTTTTAGTCSAPTFSGADCGEAAHARGAHALLQLCYCA